MEYNPFLRERLNPEQLRVLAQRHPDANKTSFFDRVSKVTITKNTDFSIVRRLQEYIKTAKTIFKSSF